MTRGRDPDQLGGYGDDPFAPRSSYATAGHRQPGSPGGAGYPDPGYPEDPYGGADYPDDGYPGYRAGPYVPDPHPSGPYLRDPHPSGPFSAGADPFGPAADPFAAARDQHPSDPFAMRRAAGGGYSDGDYADASGGYPVPDGYPGDGYPEDDGYAGDGYQAEDYYEAGSYAPDEPYDDYAGGYAPGEPTGGYAPGEDEDYQPFGQDRPGPGPDDGWRTRSGYAELAPGWDDDDDGGGPAEGTGRSGGVNEDGFIPGLEGPRRKRKRKIGRVLAPILAVVMLAAVGAAGYKFYPRFHTPDYPGKGSGTVVVQVPNGATATTLAPILVRKGVVASTRAFINAAKASKNPEGLQPGYFKLRKHMKASLAYALLLNPKSRDQIVVTIPEGMRLTDTLALLQKKAGQGLPANAYATAAKDTAALGLPSYAGGNLEGYLFPATYDITPGESPTEVLKAMVARFNQEAQQVNLTAAAAAGQMDPGGIIKMASILEAEVGPQYYADAAEVLYNRLNQGIPLGVDSTINYALNRTGVGLTQSQLNINSPYNLFQHTGLPPTPIDSPGDAAIQAALHPAHGDLLYFVTVNLQTGQTLFTDNAAQFNQDVALCQQNKAC